MSNSIHYITWEEGVSFVDTNYDEETKPYPIENLFKEGYNVYIHPKRDTATDTYFVIDFSKVIEANSITFHGKTGREPSPSQQEIQNKFSLHTSKDNKHYIKILQIHPLM